MRTFRQDPNENKDYLVNWAGALSSGETISESAWVITSGITEGTTSATDTTTTIWLSGGTSGVTYDVVNRVTTSSGRIYEHAFQVVCLDSTQQ